MKYQRASSSNSYPYTPEINNSNTQRHHTFEQDQMLSSASLRKFNIGYSANTEYFDGHNIIDEKQSAHNQSRGTKNHDTLMSQQYLSPSFAGQPFQNNNHNNSFININDQSQNNQTYISNNSNKTKQSNTQRSVSNNIQIRKTNIEENNQDPTVVGGRQFSEKLENLRSALSNIKSNLTVFKTRQSSNSPHLTTTQSFQNCQNESSYLYKRGDYSQINGENYNEQPSAEQSFYNKSFDYSHQNINRSYIDGQSKSRLNENQSQSFSNLRLNTNSSIGDMKQGSKSNLNPPIPYSYQKQQQNENVNQPQILNTYNLRLKTPLQEISNSSNIQNDGQSVDRHFQNIRLSESLDSSCRIISGQSSNLQTTKQQALPTYSLSQLNGTTIMNLGDSIVPTSKSVSPSGMTTTMQMGTVSEMNFEHDKKEYRMLRKVQQANDENGDIMRVKILEDQVNIKEQENQALLDKIKQMNDVKNEMESEIHTLLSKIDQQQNETNQFQQEARMASERCCELEKENIQLRKVKKDHESILESLDLERKSLEDNVKALEANKQRNQIYTQGLEKQLKQLKDEIDRIKSDQPQEFQLREMESQFDALQQDNWTMKQQIMDKDRQVAELENRLRDAQRAVKYDLTHRIATPLLGETQKPNKHKHRNKSSDIIMCDDNEKKQSQQNFYDNTASSIFFKQSQQSSIGTISEVFQLLGCQNFQEFIQFLKKVNSEKKFCSKIVRLVKDVEGKKPQALKECWRWVRGLLHDFVSLKKLLAEHQRILKKVEGFFNNINSQPTINYQFTNSATGAASGQSITDVDGTSCYQSKEAAITFTNNTIDQRSSYNNIGGIQNSNQYSGEGVFSIRDLGMLENAIDKKLASYRGKHNNNY